MYVAMYVQGFSQDSYICYVFTYLVEQFKPT